MPAPSATDELTERCRRVELLLLDVDGVLTDGRIIVDDRGVESKNFSVRDGTGLELWKASGRRAAILSGRRAEVVDRRAAELSISPVVQGAKDKRAAFATMLQELGLAADQVCFVGDDLPDLPVIAAAGLTVCPADAADEVRNAVDHVTQAPGGHGAVREAIEWMLKAKGEWAPLVGGRYGLSGS